MSYRIALRSLLGLLTLWPAFLAATPAAPPVIDERVLHYGAPFGDVTVYQPRAATRGVVLFLSGDGGWHLGVVSMARHLAEQGAIVAGLDVRHYLADIAAHPGACRYLAADFETLSHRLQRELHLDDYQVPLLYGYSSGATIVYATLVQAPPGTFGAAVSLGFCPDQKFGGTPLCPGPENQLHYQPGLKGAVVFDPAPHLKDRWIAFQGQSDQVCSPTAVDAYAAKVAGAQVVRLDGVGHGYGNEKKWLTQYTQLFDSLAPAVAVAPAGDSGVSDLPLIELPVAHAAADAPLVIMLSGDGGWAGLDKGLAAELNARGLPVVGLSTLKYYWKARDADESARAIARVMRHYLSAWNRTRVLLVGYSFGANLLPFIVNRLPAELHERIVGLGMLGLDERTDFEIRVSGWLPGAGGGDVPVRPEIAKLQGVRATCLYGKGEDDDPCPKLAGAAMNAVRVGSGHHFSGDYAALTTALVEGAGLSTAEAPHPQ
jgi:type IV secretory pathway VirJ component